MDVSISRRRFLGGAALAAAGTALEACLPATARPVSPRPSAASPSIVPSPNTPGADLVLRNARVLTMDPSIPAADAVAIVGDTIAAVGTETDVLAAAAPSATIVDLGGRVLLPGFNDAHCHRIGMRHAVGYETAEGAIETALASGWTSISELVVTQDRLDELQGLADANQLRLRVNCYLPVNDLAEKYGTWFTGYRPHQGLGPNLRIGGVKVFADSAWPDKMYMTEQHVDKAGYYGEVYWTPDELTELVRSLHADGWQIATHTGGDAAHDMVLDAYEAALAGVDNAEHRHRIEHVMAVRDDQVKRMADLKILASFQLTWFTANEAKEIEATLGSERLPWLGRWRDLIEAGVPAVASTDHPWDDTEPVDSRAGQAMRSLAVAITRVSEEGDTPPAWQADQAITAEQGLDLMTRAGAYATFEEDHKGTVSPGKLADLVVLADDPRSVPASDLADVDVLMTMVGGKVEYRSPDFDAY